MQQHKIKLKLHNKQEKHPQQLQHLGKKTNLQFHGQSQIKSKSSQKRHNLYQ